MEARPLIVTLQMDAESLARFDAMRRAHFPAERNFLQAHITLFHQLPGDCVEQVQRDIVEMASWQTPFAMPVRDVWHLGFGVAYRLEAGPATALRNSLVEQWRAGLTPQDANRTFTPHITVQNKVSGGESKALAARLRDEPLPSPVTAVGISLYRYCGGPWELVGEFLFP